ncbi:Hsp20/alpha crystallin family protein [candidate division KSB1 bacterium]|nr:Hsp20/alpha crystallin family protein [candidate division KSB1 bacterium]
MAEKQVAIKKEPHEVKDIERTRSNKVFIPATDIMETKDAIILSAEMPGADAASIDVTLENDVLTIQAHVEPQFPEEMTPLYREYSIGDYQRSFTLNEHIDRDKIHAEFRNGILTLNLPKAEPVKPKQIKVKSG